MAADDADALAADNADVLAADNADVLAADTKSERQTGQFFCSRKSVSPGGEVLIIAGFGQFC